MFVEYPDTKNFYNVYLNEIKEWVSITHFVCDDILICINSLRIWSSLTLFFL